MDVLAQSFVSGRRQSAANHICLAKYLVDVLLLDLSQIFLQKLKFFKNPDFFTLVCSFAKLLTKFLYFLLDRVSLFTVIRPLRDQRIKTVLLHRR